MHLHEIDWIGTELANRILHLRDAFLPSGGPYLRGDEKFLLQSDLCGQVADHFLRVSIHRGGIDKFTAKFGKGGQHFCQRRSRVLRAADVEGLPGAKADHG